MSISPFSVRPASPENERKRARLVVLMATVGIAASLLAYAISPTVRHVVGHAAHSVKGAVGRVLDHDRKESSEGKHPAGKAHTHHTSVPGRPSPTSRTATPARAPG
ncbi:MAG TPA: hypothetical protein VKG62_01350 [Solirubrobacteraceae bacterium]|nr:hypothetical protein [Solirubrobacteraceae bacterium]